MIVEPSYAGATRRSFSGIWPGPGKVVSFADGLDGITTTERGSVLLTGRVFIKREEELLATQKGWRSIVYHGDLVSVER